MKAVLSRDFDRLFANWTESSRERFGLLRLPRDVLRDAPRFIEPCELLADALAAAGILK